jgi:CO/xanthine dehydrogenase Mo-binding subunit
MLLEGQIDGGIGMGIGYALLEKVILDKGVIQNLDFRAYLIPTSLNVPQIDAKLIEMHNIHGPYGAKGLGEMPNIPTPAMVNNAIGTRIFELPIDSGSV